MTLIDRLERRFGWVAIPGVVKVIVAFQALIWVLNMFRDDDQLFHKLLYFGTTEEVVVFWLRRFSLQRVNL